MNRTALLLPVAILGLALAMARPARAEQAPAFSRARAVWPEGREQEMNLLCGFRTTFEAPERGGVVLRLAGYSLYRIYLNGEFIGHGPARGPHGWFRVDEWELARFLRPGSNLLAVELAGYNINSYYLLDQPSFLQAELVAGRTGAGRHRAAGRTLRGAHPEGADQKVQRYSFQRTFSRGPTAWLPAGTTGAPATANPARQLNSALPAGEKAAAARRGLPRITPCASQVRGSCSGQVWTGLKVRPSRGRSAACGRRTQVRRLPARRSWRQSRPSSCNGSPTPPISRVRAALERPAEFAGAQELSYQIVDFGCQPHRASSGLRSRCREPDPPAADFR